MNGSEQGKSVFLAPSPSYQLGIWVEETLLEFESVWELRKCLPDRGKQKFFWGPFSVRSLCVTWNLGNDGLQGKGLSAFLFL